MSEKESKRFQDWTEVDCNQCARYWDSSCDAVQGTGKPCNSYIATRNIVIPAKIERLTTVSKLLLWNTLFLDVILIFQLIGWM